MTNLLLEKMKDTARATGVEGRIVNLSSIAHIHTYEEGIKFDTINDEKRCKVELQCFEVPSASELGA